MNARRTSGSAMILIGLAGAVAQGCGSPDATSSVAPVSSSSPLLSVGSSAALDAGGTVALSGGDTGGEFVLVIADTAVDGTTAASSFQIAATGVSIAGAVSAPSTSRSPASGDAQAVSPRLDFAYAAQLNERAHRELLPRVSGARRAYQQASTSPRGASFSRSTAALQVGDLVTLNVASRACDSLINRASRVVAIGTKSIVVADTLNPAGGFSTADYQKFAARFDTLVYPVDVDNFGAPADFGIEGKILLFFTKAVNELTPRGSTSYVGGFFFDRDLFPVTSTPDLQGCPGSNVGELFYLLTPDPTGSVNGNIRRTGFVDSVTTAVLAHEFQHLINASRRIYVNKSTKPFEVVWLNEGLSHIAEELLFYREGGSGPRLNLDVNAIRARVALKDAFNADQSANAQRYRLYLEAPSTNSPIRNDDSLGTRGATWDFLRYAADRKLRSGGSDASVWFALVNSQANGLANLRQVFGANLGGMLRDWSVSHYTDDVVPGVSSDFMQASWNWHSLFAALASTGGYPLAISGLPAAGTSGSAVPGGANFYRFSVAAKANASIKLTAPQPIGGVIVRIR